MRAARRSVGSIVSVVLVVLAVLAAGCSGDEDSSQPAATSRPRASTTSSAPPDPIVCNGTDEFNQDDDGAVPALLQPSQLAGDWTVAEMPPCPWALSADELLAVPECRAAAASADAPANDESRNGNARVAYTSADGVQVDDRIEIYTSRQNVDAIRAILVSPSLPECYAQALQEHAAGDHGTTVDDVTVTSFDVQVDPATLGLGFPATEDYAADPGFVHGADVSFTSASERSNEPIALRVITFGTGGLMSTLTLIGATPADVEAVDVTNVLRGAASSFRAMFEPG